MKVSTKDQYHLPVTFTRAEANTLFKLALKEMQRPDPRRCKSYQRWIEGAMFELDHALRFRSHNRL